MQDWFRTAIEVSRTSPWTGKPRGNVEKSARLTMLLLIPLVIGTGLVVGFWKMLVGDIDQAALVLAHVAVLTVMFKMQYE